MTYDEAVKLKESMPKYVNVAGQRCLVMIVPELRSQSDLYITQITDWTNVNDVDSRLFALDNQFRVVAYTGGSNGVLFENFPH
jgi:hypothetical protein